MNGENFVIGFYGLAIAVLLGIMLVVPSFEAKSFNRCTGSNASYWDALTTELRIERCQR